MEFSPSLISHQASVDVKQYLLTYMGSVLDPWPSYHARERSLGSLTTKSKCTAEDWVALLSPPLNAGQGDLVVRLTFT